MEDQVEYTSVVFKNGHPPPTANKEEQTVYSEVKPTPAACASNTAGGKKPAPVKVHVLTVVMVALCVLLMVSVALLVYLAVSMSSQSSKNQRLSTEVSLLRNNTEHLQKERVRLANQNQELSREKIGLINLTQDLSRQRNQLNWTLQVIMKFTQFPVSSFCPNKQCQPCLNEWLLFENKCYFFYDQNPWKTWDQSQTYCKQSNPISDLVVIDSAQEQEFIHKNIKYYYDQYHGFWIGLTLVNNSWIWVDRQMDSLGFWMKTALGTSGPYALVIPNQPSNESWDPAENIMQNKFICESTTLILI